MKHSRNYKYLLGKFSWSRSAGEEDKREEDCKDDDYKEEKQLSISMDDTSQF